mmetsp:Transcript_20449/g.65464  ORF Transcript_20449/g.65464 Transcript_20449/m.65464 type:complete len:225 (-) Transcript_20449:186-860(-)
MCATSCFTARSASLAAAPMAGCSSARRRTSSAATRAQSGANEPRNAACKASESWYMTLLAAFRTAATVRAVARAATESGACASTAFLMPAASPTVNSRWARRMWAARLLRSAVESSTLLALVSVNIIALVAITRATPSWWGDRQMRRSRNTSGGRATQGEPGGGAGPPAMPLSGCANPDGRGAVGVIAPMWSSIRLISSVAFLAASRRLPLPSTSSPLASSSGS